LIISIISPSHKSCCCSIHFADLFTRSRYVDVY